MDKRHLQPKDRNDRVKLDMVRQYAAAQAREAANAKENLLRDKCAGFIARGYCVEDLELVEQAGIPGMKLLGKIDVRLSAQGQMVWPVTLWIRRQKRRIFPYRYAVKADRVSSVTAAGIE